MRTIQTDWFGEIPVSLHRAIRKYNVSPSDFDELASVYGDDFAAIECAIRQYASTGNFSVFEFWKRPFD